MKQISSLDLYFLTNELKILENQRIDSFYLDNNIFYMKVYVKNKGNKLLTFNVGKSIYIGDKKEDSSMPTSFVQYLRKYLKNAFITNVEQIFQERILKIKIESKKDDKITIYYLFLEVFSPGNIVLTNENLEIINTLKRKTFKDRKVAVKEKYELPPKKELSFFEIDEKKIIEKFKTSDLSIVKFLAINFGIGGKYAEEICFLSKVDKNKQELSEKEFNLINNNIKKIINTQIKPFLVDEKDFIPFDFKSMNKEKKEFETFNEVLKNYFESFNEEKDKNEEKYLKELKKLENRLKKQTESKEKVEKDYGKYNSIGNKIYENYVLIEEILNSINNAAKEKGWDYVKEKIKSEEKLKMIKSLNYKNNEIILDL